MNIRCFFKKNKGFENFAAAKSTVDEATITRPINIKLMIHDKKSESRPRLSKNSMVLLILLASMFIN